MNSFSSKKIGIILQSVLCAGLLLGTSANVYAATLPELNQSAGYSRVYDFVAGESVTLEENMGVTGDGSFTVRGLDKSSNSVVFNSLSGFVVSNPETQLSITNLTLTGAQSESGSILSYTAENSNVSLNNLTISNNTAHSSDDVRGGAIYTESELEITNTDFVGNSAVSDNGTAKGGAIYSNGSLSLVADSDNIEIVDNYTEDTSGRTQNAVYIGNSGATLTVSAQNKGTVQLKDDVSGVNGYNAVLTGDNTGRIYVNNIEKASNVSTSNVEINFADGETTNHKIDNIDIGENTKFIIDVDLENEQADTLTSQNGSGIMNLSEINFTTSSDNPDVTVKVLDNAGNTQLSIDALSSKVVQSISIIMHNDDILADSVTLATVTRPNDGITISGAKDLLYEMAKYKGSTNLIFRTDTPYTLTKDLEESAKESSLTISNISRADYGVIDANGHSMFKLKNSISTVTISDMEIKNAHTDGNGSVATLENSTSYLNANNVKFTNNSADGNGGAVYSYTGNPSITNSTFENNTAGGDGGAVYIANDSAVIQNDNFINNSANGNGGAIYTKGSLTVSANDGDSNFEGNTAGGENNAIYVDDGGTLTLDARNNGNINMKDKISGTDDKYNFYVTGDSTGNVNLDNTVENANITLRGSSLNLAQDDLLAGNSFNASGGTLNLVNGQIGNTDFSSFSARGTTNIAVDVDLANKSMDRITSEIYNYVGGTINVSKINLLSSTEDRITKILFADDELKGHVKNSVPSVAYSKIYKYKVSYSKSTGYFTFSRGKGPTPHPPVDIFNPAVLTGSVGQQTAYMNQLINYEYATYHADTYMMLPKKVRKGMYNKNSAANGDNVFDGENYAPTYVQIPEEVKSIWVRPYTSFESVPLKNGPKITSINYGLLAGGDSDMINLKHDFKLVYGGYFGYNGNNYHYKGINATQQGGVIGGTVHLYRGNFFNVFTANAGWAINNSDTKYGSDFMNMMMAGFSDKFGYNIEIKGGKLILQPAIRMGYTFVGNLDYTTSNNVKIRPEPLHVMHFIPGIKIIGNLANGWQPYLLVNVVCNFGNSAHFRADNVILPAMSVDPYVEYGLGLQKRWGDKYSGFVQATARSGGRRGGAVLFGFRYMLGKLAEKTCSLFHPDPERKMVMFKEKKDPNIVVEKIVKHDQQKQTVAKYTKKDTTKVASATDKQKQVKKPKNALKRLKEKIMYICHKDVSAKVVNDVHPDGVYNSGLAGMKPKSKNVVETKMNFKDNDRDTQFGAKPVNIARDFNDYKVSQVNIDVEPAAGVSLKADAIKKIFTTNRILYLNQRNYGSDASSTNYQDFDFELINIQF